MRWDSHLVAGHCEQMVILGRSSFGAGFVATGSSWNGIIGDEFEHVVQEGGFFEWAAPGRADGGGERAQRARVRV